MEQTASEIMSRKLVTVSLEDSVRKAYQVMKERNIRHLPVTDELGEIIGILSDRDLQRAMLPHVEMARNMDEDPAFDPQSTTKDFMSWPVQSIERDRPIAEITRLILMEKVSALLVVDHGKTAVGIITTDDLLKLLLKLLEQGFGESQMTIDYAMQEFGFSPGHFA